MNTNDSLFASGKLKIILADAQGHIIDERDVDNLVVTAGRTYIASRMKDATATAMTHMSVGTGSTAAVIGDTTLGTEIAASRVALTSTVASTNTIVYVATFGSGVGTGAITEAGIFNAASAGTMLCRTVFSVVNKAAGDTMNITWTITIS